LRPGIISNYIHPEYTPGTGVFVHKSQLPRLTFTHTLLQLPNASTLNTRWTSAALQWSCGAKPNVSRAVLDPCSVSCRMWKTLVLVSWTSWDNYQVPSSTSVHYDINF